jgi:hypothetical protein
MSDEVDWNFANEAEAKAELRAAAEYLLRGATAGARGDIVEEIIAMVRDVANGPTAISLIPWTMVCRADEVSQGRRHGWQL